MIEPSLLGQLNSIEKVTATDNYTLIFKLKTAGALVIYQVLEGAAIVAPEWVEQGNLQNWKNVVGTGPWMLTDVVQGTSLTFRSESQLLGS